MKTALLFIASACGFAQIQRPALGVMLDSGGNARIVSGVPASTTVSDPLWTGVASLACSTQVCFALANHTLLSSDGNSFSIEGEKAVWAIDGAGAYVYLSDTGRLWRWHDGQFGAVEFAPEGEVLALRAIPDGLEYATRTPDGVRLGERSLGNADAVFLLEDGRVLVAGAGILRLWTRSGTYVDFALEGVRGFVEMSDVCVQIQTSSGNWALTTEAGHERLFMLPGVGTAE